MLRFKKQLNGNVLITDENDKPIANYATPINLFKHQTQQSSLLITDDASYMETDKGLIVSFANVDQANCQPVIVAADIDQLIEALAANFFFRKPVLELVYKGEFAYNQDIILYSGDNFDILYEGATRCLKVNNKQNEWFDVFAEVTKGSSSFVLASDVDLIGEFYFSTTGNYDSNYSLNNFYASHMRFRVARESVYGKEIFIGELMLCGSVINANMSKIKN